MLMHLPPALACLPRIWWLKNSWKLAVLDCYRFGFNISICRARLLFNSCPICTFYPFSSLWFLGLAARIQATKVMLRIAVTGPESSGKTTLCGALAEHYQVSYIPEYARTYLEQTQGQYQCTDLDDYSSRSARKFTFI